MSLEAKLGVPVGHCTGDLGLALPHLVLMIVVLPSLVVQVLFALEKMKR